MANLIAVTVGGIPLRNAKSFSYDEAPYLVAHGIPGSVAAATVSPVVWANGTSKLTTFVQRQLKSLMIVPLTAPTVASDNWNGTLTSLYAQNFNGPLNPTGTYTQNACYTTTPGYTGTLTSTGLQSIMVFTGTLGQVEGTGAVGGVSGTGGNSFPPALGTQNVNQPYVSLISGGTCTVACSGPSGTWTVGNYVFPTGPNGGLTMNPGDIFTMAKGTDSVAIYAVELESVYTPGSAFTI